MKNEEFKSILNYKLSELSNNKIKHFGDLEIGDKFIMESSLYLGSKFGKPTIYEKYNNDKANRESSVSDEYDILVDFDHGALCVLIMNNIS